MRSELRRLDLVFCVELTANMGGLIASARERIGNLLEPLRTELGADLRVGFVGFRDGTVEVVDLSSDVVRLQRAFVASHVEGDGDSLQALFAAMSKCLELSWAQGSFRSVILIGRPPVSSLGPRGDGYLRHPVGLAVDDLAIRLGAQNLFVDGISVSPQDEAFGDAFRWLSDRTSSRCRAAASVDVAMDVVEAVTRSLLHELEFDAKLLPLLQQGLNEDEFDGPWQDFLAGRMRLRQRGLFRDKGAIELELMLRVRRAAITARIEDLETAATAIVKASEENPSFLEYSAADLVKVAVSNGFVPRLEEIGFLPRLALSPSSEARHVAANAYWKLGRPELAAELQNQAAALEGPVSAPMSEEERVESAIENYAALGTLPALDAAVEGFLDLGLALDTWPFHLLTLVGVLEKHQHWRTKAVEDVLSALSSLPADQLVLRTVAFMCWRRDEKDAASRWQQASLEAPESVLFSIDDEHSMALVMNQGARATP